MARSIEEKFELLELLGEGAAGSVHRARLRETGEEVALKILHGVEVGIPQTRERFAQEAKLLMQVRSPYVVRAITAGAVEGRMYLAMEFVRRARDLGAWTDEEQPDAPRAREVAAGIAEGLAAVHAQGVVHRDLKPPNVLVGVDDVPRLADFGLAKSQEGGVRTATGIVLGTPGYMAPEVLRGKAPSPAADVYALGATLYRLLAGRDLFDQEDLRELLDAQLAGPPEAALGALEKDDATLVRWLTAPEPTHRPAALEAAGALRKGHAPPAAKTMATAAALPEEAATKVLPSVAGPRPAPPPPRPSPVPGPLRSLRVFGLATALLGLAIFAWPLAPEAPPATTSAPLPPTLDPVEAWVSRVLDLRLPDLSQDLRIAAHTAFPPDPNQSAELEAGRILEKVNEVLIQLPGQGPPRAPYIAAIRRVGEGTAWRKALRDAPDLTSWWHADATDEGLRTRRRVASLFLKLWPLSTTLRALDAPLPHDLARIPELLAPVVRLSDGAHVGPATDGAPLVGLNDTCWTFMNATFGGFTTLVDVTPKGGFCRGDTRERAGFAATLVDGDLARAPPEDVRSAPVSPVSVPGGEWVELTTGFFDMHPAAALVLSLKGAESGWDTELLLPFHLPDQEVAQREFKKPFLQPGFFQSSTNTNKENRPGLHPVRQSHWIHSILLPDQVHIRVWVRPLATHLLELQRAVAAAVPIRCQLTALTWRGVERVPPPPEG